MNGNGNGSGSAGPSPVQKNYWKVMEAIDLLSSSSDEEEDAANDKVVRIAESNDSTHPGADPKREEPDPASGAAKRRQKTIDESLRVSFSGGTASNGSPCDTKDHRARRVLDSFFEAGASKNAASARDALALQRSLLESDTESDGSGSGGIAFNSQLLLCGGGFSASTPIDLLDDESPPPRSGTEGAAPAWIGSGSPSGRHRNGRRRRLEAVRSRNLRGEDGPAESPSESDADGDRSDVDPNSPSGTPAGSGSGEAHGPGAESTDRAHRGQGAATGRIRAGGLSPPDGASTACGPGTEPTGGSPSEAAGTLATASETSPPNAHPAAGATPARAVAATLAAAMPAAAAAPSGTLPPLRKLTARKTSFLANAKHKTGADASGPAGGNTAFENLYMNGKDFMVWAGITDPVDFLHLAKELPSRVNTWRKDRGSPPLSDPAGYIRTLKRQILDHRKSVAASAKKRGIRVQRDKWLPKRQRLVYPDPQNKDKGEVFVYPSLDDIPGSAAVFLKDMGITSAQEALGAKGLAKHLNEWRERRNKAPLQSPNNRVSHWKTWIRKNTVVKRASGESTPACGNPVVGGSPDTGYEDIDVSSCMELVPPLSKRFLSAETGLPVYQFAVFDKRTKDIIYEFRVEAKPSWIPNAGNGAFLTFLGARKARQPSSPDPDPKSEQNVIQPLVSKEKSKENVIQPLVSKDSDGYHMNVKIAGECFQGENSPFQYPHPTSLPSIYVSPERISLDGSKQHPWDLGSEGNIFLAQYFECPERTFSTDQEGCSTIELGRYGPFRRSDRKTQLHYDIKNFVFSNETSEWGFDILEELNGEEQVADVTDDSTGMPHLVAERNISMYVNETGGDPELKQTVWSKHVLDREVNYFFKTKEAMKKGETIELLISYFGTYDEIRERKGYGERNKTGQARSDDHFPSFLERNFVERYDMIEVIYEVPDAMVLYRLSEFLEGIRSNLAEITEAFIRDMQSSSEGIQIPFAQQIIALRRLNWMKPYFMAKIENMQKKIDKSRHKNAAVAGCHSIVLKQCIANAKSLDWGSWPVLMDLLDKNPNLVDRRGINLRTKFREEITEDICYGVNSTLLCPCNETVWCAVAATLTHDLCYMIARDSWDYSKAKPSEKLSDDLMQKGLEASKAIRSPTSINDLKFDWTVWKRYSLRYHGETQKERHGTESVLTLPDDCETPEQRLPVPIILTSDHNTEQASILKTIHQPWYLTRQIVFLVNLFAQKYLVEDKSYSFEKLCKVIDVPVETTLMFLKRDIKVDRESCLFFGKDFVSIYSTGNNLHNGRNGSFASDGENTRPKKRNRTNNSSMRGMPVKKLIFWNILVKELLKIGWSIERGNRPNDWYILPPGVKRGQGFKPRVDFFDSCSQLLQCLNTDPRYCNQASIKFIVHIYKACLDEYDKMRSLKAQELKSLNDEDMVTHLRRLVEGTSNKSQVKDAVIEGTSNKSQVKEVVIEGTSNKSQVKDAVVHNGGMTTITKVKVVFHTKQLGLMLMKVKEGKKTRVTVKDVKNEDYKTKVNSGDVIVAIEEHDVKNETLSDVCNRLRDSARPIAIIFERNVQTSVMNQTQLSKD